MEIFHKIPNNMRGKYNEDLHVWQTNIFHFRTVAMKKNIFLTEICLMYNFCTL